MFKATLSAGVASAIGLVTVLATTPAMAAGGEYVALGDSYSSGLGAGDYDSSSGNCQRSNNAYPKLWQTDNAPTKFSFVACSGAKTGDVNANQISALSASTSLVSITIGGNDAGFSSVVSTCQTGDAACKNATDNAKNYINTSLGSALDGTYNKIKQAAPSAKVVVLGYPHIYNLNPACVTNVSVTSRGYMNDTGDVLDAKVEERAKAAGFDFADVRSAFTGHEICSVNSWINDLGGGSGAFHPTKTGQEKGYYPVFRSAAG